MTKPDSIESTALEALINCGEFGLVLADAHQIVYFCRGKLAEPMTLNKPLCESFAPLVGMRQKFLDVQTERAATLIIPALSIVNQQGKSRKISIEIVWNKDFRRYTILVHPAMSDAEEEIIRKLRTKRLAEKYLNANAFARWPGPLPRAELAAPVTRYAVPPAKLQNQANPGALASLTARERDIVRLLVDGNSNKNMARILKLSPKTIEAHRARAIKRLGLKTSAELIRLAVEAGWPPAEK